MTNTTQPNLRARQQLTTKREIVATALDLFETRGFRGTTIEDIAQSVGVSARTVFRHFATKSDLVLGWLPRVEALVQDVPLTDRTPRSALAQLELTFEEMLDQPTEATDSEATDSFARYRRLVSTDPDLQSAIAAWQARLNKLARTKLRQLLGDTTDELDIQLIIQLAAAPITAAVEAWTPSHGSDLITLYRQAKARRDELICPPARQPR